MAGINRAARLKLHEAQPFYFEPFKYINDMTDNEYIEILIAFFDAKDAAHGHTGKEVQEWLKSLKYKLKPDSGWIPKDEKQLHELFHELINAGRDMEKRDRMRLYYMPEEEYWQSVKTRYLTPTNP